MMRRWIRRLFWTGLVLLLAGLLVAEIVRRSDLPRQVVLQIVSDSLGVDVSSTSLRAGWGGHTTLTHLVLRDHGDGEIIADFDRVQVDHTSLWLLALGWPFDIHAIETGAGAIALRENQLGQWNIHPMLDALTGEGDGRDVTLPSLRTGRVTVSIIPLDRTPLRIEPVEVAFEPDNHPARHQWHVTLGQFGQISGKLVTGASMTHQADFELKDLQSLLGLWSDDTPDALAIRGHWQGRLTSHGAQGHLTIADFHWDDVEVHGDLAVNMQSLRAVSLRPHNLVIASRTLLPMPLTVAQGAIELDGEHLKADQIIVELAGNQIHAAGHLDLATREASLELAGSGLIAAAGFTVEGELSLTAQGQGAGIWHVHGTHRLDASDGHHRGQSHGQATVTLGNWQDVTLALNFDRLHLAAPAWDVDLAELSSHWQWTGDTLRLMALHVTGDPDFAGSGQYHLPDGTWQGSLRGGYLPVRYEQLPRTAFEINLAGTRFESLDMRRFILHDDAHALDLTGTWRRDRDQPLEVAAILKRTQPLHHELAGLLWGARDIVAQADARGTLLPLHLDLQGGVRFQDLRLGEHKRAELDIPMRGRATGQGVFLESQPVTLLDGQWTMGAAWTVRDNTLRATMDLIQAPLARAEDVLGEAMSLQGVLDASVKVELPDLNLNRMDLKGQWQLQEGRFHQLQITQAQGQVDLRDDLLVFEAVTLHCDEGHADTTFTLDLPARVLTLAFDADAWPVALEPMAMQLIVSGHGDLRLDLRSLSATGPLDLQVQVRWHEQPAARVQLVGVMDHRRLMLNTIEGTLLGGHLRGAGIADLQTPLLSDLHIEASGLEVSQLVAHLPQIGKTHGTLDAHFTITPDSDPRAHGPIKGTLVLSGEDVRYRGLDFQSATTTAWLVPSQPDQGHQRWLDRLLVEESHWQLAQGSVTGWGRLFWRPDGGHYYAQANLSDIDVASMVKAFERDASRPPPQGRLDGALLMIGQFDDPARRYGTADLRLRDADLANEGLIAGLYDLLNLDFQDRAPTGVGRATLRVEGQRVIVTQARFANRGVLFQLAGQLDDLALARESPIRGFAIATTSVLPDVPVLAQLDSIMGTVQSYTNGIQFTGTLDEPTVFWIPMVRAAAALHTALPRQ